MANMTATTACPTSDDLKSFLHGEFKEAKCACISDHVELCAHCQEILQTISPEDTLLEDARGDFSQTERLAADIPRPLLEILKKLPERTGLIHGDTEVFDDLTTADSDSSATFLAPPQQPDEIGRLGAYRVLAVLGKGGMGMVFLAHDPKLDRRVALKVMLPRFAAHEGAKRRFLREARAAAKLNSDNIVRIYQVDEDRGIPFFAMELLEGAALDQFLKQGPRLTLAEVVRIGRETAAGLAAAHEKNLIHRDIKPSNLWLDKTNAGRVKILDFGLACSVKDDVNLTQSGTIVGTPAFMAPEQARGDKDVDARADLFSLGCVLYRLCAGDVPFKGETTMGVLLAIAVNSPVPLMHVNGQVPSSLSTLIMQMLAKDPMQRPASAIEVGARLQTIEREIASAGGDRDSLVDSRKSTPGISNSAVDASATTLAIPPKPPRRRGWPLLLGGLAVALPFLLAAVIYWQTRDGVVRIESDDPAIQIAFDKDELKIVGAYNEPLAITAGQHGLKIKKGNDFELETDKLIVNHGETVALKIEFVHGEVRIVQEGKGVLDAKRLTQQAGNADAKQPKFLYSLPWMDEQQGFAAHLSQTEISSDGKLFFAAGDTGPAGAIRVCETATGKQVQSLIPGGDAWYGYAKFLPGSNFIVASYNKKKELCLYDIASGMIIREFVGHEQPGPFFTVSPDGKHILSWDDDQTLRLWDVATGAEIEQLKGHTDKAAGVFSPDSTQILTFSPDNTLRLWSVATGKELKKLEGHTEAPTGCFSPDGKQALSYSRDGTIRLWDLASGKQINEYRGPKAPVAFAGFVADGRLVVGNSLSDDHDDAGKPVDMDFRVWDAKTGKLLQEIDCTRFGEDRWTFTVTPDGRQGVVNQQDGSVRVIDMVTGKETHCFDNCRKARAFSFSGNLVVAGSFRAGVFVFRLATPSADGGWKLGAE